MNSILLEINTFDTRDEYRVKMTIFEQLKWKFAYYRSDKEYIDVSILDSVQKPNSNGVLVWVFDELNKYTVKSPFYNKIDDAAIFIKIAIEFINFIYDMSVKDRKMYAHYIIDGVKYCPWMNPDDKEVLASSDTLEVLEFRLDTDDIISIIKNILNFPETVYRRKAKEYTIYDILLLKSRDAKILHERDIEDNKIKSIVIDVDYFQVALFVDKNAIIKTEEKKEESKTEESKYEQVDVIKLTINDAIIEVDLINSTYNVSFIEDRKEPTPVPAGYNMAKIGTTMKDMYKGMTVVKSVRDIMTEE